MNKKEIREKLSGVADSVTFKREGYIDIKRSYFYRHGMTEQKLALAVVRLFPNAKILSKTDRWAPYPRESYFFVRFVLEDPTKLQVERDLEDASFESETEAGT